MKEFSFAWLLLGACVGGLLRHFWRGGRRVEARMERIAAELRHDAPPTPEDGGRP